MMFSERLEYGKYDFQHLQGTVRVQKPVQFRGFSAKSTVFAVMSFEDFFFCVSRLSKIFFSKKKKLFWKQFFLVTALGLLYPDLKFEGNRRRSDLSQRNIGTSRNWSKMSTSELILFEPQRIQSHGTLRHSHTDNAGVFGL